MGNRLYLGSHLRGAPGEQVVLGIPLAGSTVVRAVDVTVGVNIDLVKADGSISENVCTTAQVRIVVGVEQRELVPTQQREVAVVHAVHHLDAALTANLPNDGANAHVVGGIGLNAGQQVGHAHAVTQQVDGPVEVVLGDGTQLGASLGIVQQDLGIPEDGSVGPVTIGALTVGVVDQVGIEQEYSPPERSGAGRG